MAQSYIKKISKISLWLISTLVLVSFSLEGASMSLFSTKTEVVLSSPLEGILTYEGQPLPNVKIERKLSWYDGEGEQTDFVVTDEKGYFNLPIIKKELKVSGYVRLVIVQEIFSQYKNENALIWVMAKKTKSKYSEIGGKPVNIHCDLAIEPWIYRNTTGTDGVTTRCKWDSIEKIDESK
ncbi:hypothetical protein MNBD_GAMMA07-678 [hydrothermal vent metagenome]|uniref:DUF6795 domain-containing protein n=1 Tax=hydrothermal vent metagenome TaxID=652676 RepID=A0A3B0WZ57_9ZZZZ